MSEKLVRREFLKGLGGLALTRGALPGFAGATLAGCGESPLPNALATIYEDPAAAAIVGRVYLEQFPEEANVEILVAGIAGDQRSRLRRLATDHDALLRALAELHAVDFAEDRLVTVDRWVLSRTEARLCALAAQARAT